MGFLQKVKNKLGIGGVKVAIQVPNEIPKTDSGVVDGTVILTTKSPQEILTLTVKMVEEFTTGYLTDKSTKEYELGEIEINGGFDIKPGETKEVDFSVPFAMLKSNNDVLKEKGGVMGKIGKASAFVSGERSKFFVDVEVDVKSAFVDPTAKEQIQLV